MEETHARTQRRAFFCGPAALPVEYPSVESQDQLEKMKQSQLNERFKREHSDSRIDAGGHRGSRRLLSSDDDVGPDGGSARSRPG